MRTAIVAAVLAVCLTNPLHAQSGGHIGVYADNPGFSACHLQEALYVTNSIWVVHTLIAEANTSQFMVTHDWTAIVGSVFYHGNLNLGDPYTGVTITYVGCKPLPHLLCELQFIPIAPTPPCGATFNVVPDPALPSGQIEVVDCSSNVLFATGGIMYINGNGIDCSCEPATEQSTWSRLKALYQ
jgi:hypothetical protein